MAVNDTKTTQRSIISLNSPKDIGDFLKQPTIAIAEFLTGVLASDLSEYKLSTGKIVQSVVKGNLFTQLGREIEKYRKEGKIKEDYFATNKSQASLLELLQFIDSDLPDEEVFQAMKSIFLTGISKESTAKDEELSYQLLIICKKLTSLEILILKSCYQIYLENTMDFSKFNAYGNWENEISKRIGYDLPELIGASDQKLIDLGLLSGRSYSDKSGVRTGREFRLTRLSLKLCEYIHNWKK